MKKAMGYLLIIFLIFTFSACGRVGNTASVELVIGESQQFSEREIHAAIDRVKLKFRGFQGCTLTKLWYDEEQSNNIAAAYIQYGKGSVNGAKTGDVMVLLADFTVDASGGDGSLNPNSTYSSWKWILVREQPSGPWRVDDWGY